MMLLPFHKNGKWGFVDWHKETAISPIYDEIGVFSEGLAPVRIGDKWGYINVNGEMVIDMRFDDAGEFINGHAFVVHNGVEYRIDENGNVLLPGVYVHGAAACWIRFVRCIGYVECKSPLDKKG